MLGFNIPPEGGKILILYGLGKVHCVYNSSVVTKITPHKRCSQNLSRQNEGSAKKRWKELTRKKGSRRGKQKAARLTETESAVKPTRCGRNVQNRPLHRNRQWSRGSPGQGQGRWARAASQWVWGFFLECWEHSELRLLWGQQTANILRTKESYVLNGRISRCLKCISIRLQ